VIFSAPAARYLLIIVYLWLVHKNVFWRLRMQAKKKKDKTKQKKLLFGHWQRQTESRNRIRCGLGRRIEHVTSVLHGAAMASDGATKRRRAEYLALRVPRLYEMKLALFSMVEAGSAYRCAWEEDSTDGRAGETTATVTREEALGMSAGAEGGAVAGTGGGTKSDSISVARP
jgi:hypothetical protein